MQNRILVEITRAFHPEYNKALTRLPAQISNQTDQARWVVKKIREQVREDTARGPFPFEEKPVVVSMGFDLPANQITVVVAFPDPEAAMLFKLAHGGTA